MRIALIAPPFIPIPPKRYGGTELFVEQLALGLKSAGMDVVVYTNGESTVPVERKWLYPRSDWPLHDDVYFSLRDMQHQAWAVRDAAQTCDVIHVNNVTALSYSKYVSTPFVYTVHHPMDEALAEIYAYYPDVHYVCISQFQSDQMRLPQASVIHHGIEQSLYPMKEAKQDYLVFLGRIAPVKGVHLAIQVAKKSGVPLKIAGQVQPLYQRYWENDIKPLIDGRFIEFVGEVDIAEKSELLGNARALIFPIQWHEPFGLVMVEAMACGTPVLALPGGSVEEIVKEGISGHICRTADEMAKLAKEVNIPAMTVRKYVDEKFSVNRMVEAYVAKYKDVAWGQMEAGLSPESRIA